MTGYTHFLRGIQKKKTETRTSLLTLMRLVIRALGVAAKIGEQVMSCATGGRRLSTIFAVKQENMRRTEASQRLLLPLAVIEPGHLALDSRCSAGDLFYVEWSCSDFLKK